MAGPPGAAQAGAPTGGPSRAPAGAVRTLTRPPMLLLHLAAVPPGAPAGAVPPPPPPPMLLLHLAAVLAVLATALLGRWQVHAWQDHRQDRSLTLVHAPAKPLAAVIGRDDPFPAVSVGQPVTF